MVLPIITNRVGIWVIFFYLVGLLNLNYKKIQFSVAFCFCRSKNGVFVLPKVISFCLFITILLNIFRTSLSSAPLVPSDFSKKYTCIMAVIILSNKREQKIENSRAAVSSRWLVFCTPIVSKTNFFGEKRNCFVSHL